MLAEVTLVIEATGARLVLKRGEKVVEDEVWVFNGRKIGRTEAAEVAEVVFHDTYDLLQYSVHGE